MAAKPTGSGHCCARSGSGAACARRPRGDRQPQHAPGFCFGEDSLLRRHDHHVDIAGVPPGRRLAGDPSQVAVSIGLSGVRFG